MALSSVATSQNFAALNMQQLLQSAGHKRHGQPQSLLGDAEAPTPNATASPRRAGAVGGKLDVSA
jgi:hypothetical protein